MTVTYTATSGVHLADLDVRFTIDHQRTATAAAARTATIYGVGPYAQLPDITKLYSATVEDSTAALIDALPAAQLTTYGTSRVS